MSTIQFFLKKIATLRVRLIARVTHFTRVPTRARAIARVSLTGLYDHHYTNKIIIKFYIEPPTTKHFVVKELFC